MWRLELLFLWQDSLKTDSLSTKTRWAQKPQKHWLTFALVSVLIQNGLGWHYFSIPAETKKPDLEVFNHRTPDYAVVRLDHNHVVQVNALFSLFSVIYVQQAIFRVAQMSKAIVKRNHLRLITFSVWLASNDWASLWHFRESLDNFKRSGSLQMQKMAFLCWCRVEFWQIISNIKNHEIHLKLR